MGIDSDGADRRRSKSSRRPRLAVGQILDLQVCIERRDLL